MFFSASSGQRAHGAGGVAPPPGTPLQTWARRYRCALRAGVVQHFASLDHALLRAKLAALINRTSHSNHRCPDDKSQPSAAVKSCKTIRFIEPPCNGPCLVL